jgi:GPI ethanolamine phosphate transferase 3 subunit O
MELKIKQISAFMEKLMKAMGNDTLLLVTGDHGMRDDGNHGGSS